MNYAVVGYGKMGRAIDAVATARGHRRVVVVDRAGAGRGIARSVARARFPGVAVAFEFTEAASAHANVLALLQRGIAVVCGTTGWDGADPEIVKAARAGKAGAIIAPNFSVGMNLFYAVVEAAAGRYRAAGFDAWIAEWHHRGKRDAPSGTAKRLAAIAGGDVPVAAVRAGHEPGRHVVGFDGPHDTIALSHAARGRDGFAAGAVLAAEWLKGKKGVRGFDEVLDDLVRTRRGGRR